MMRVRVPGRLLGAIILPGCLLLVGCGDVAGMIEAVDSSDMDMEDVDSGFGVSTPEALDAGPVTVVTESGHATVTAEGRTIDHTPAESGGAFRCSFAEDQINFEVTSEFGSMVLRASRTDDGWLGTFTADSDEEGWIQYTAQPFDGDLGIDLVSDTLSYVGTAMRHDRDAMADGDLDTPTVDVTVAVNCGIDPATVEVGGQSFTYSPFAADHMTCRVSGPDSVDITFNTLATQRRQLQFSLRPDGDGVIGNVAVTEGEDKWIATVSTADGTADGLAFDANTVTFTGTFVHTSDADPNLSEEVDGTADVTCPV